MENKKIRDNNDNRNNKIKRIHGSIVITVLVSLIMMLVPATVVLKSTIDKKTTVEKEIEEIKEEYDEDDELEDIYEEYKNETYQIKFELNGGNFIKGKEPTKEELEYNEDMLPKVIDLNKFEANKKGYIFKEWKSENNKVTIINNKVTINKGIKDLIVIRAIYEPIIYQIKFDSNGGTNSMSNQNFKYDELQKLNPNQFTKLGETFLGWNTESNGTGKAFKDNEEIINLTDRNEELRLYAQWEKIKNTVRYNYAENGGQPTAKTSEVLEYGQPIDLTVKSEKPGYDFLGWSENVNGTEKIDNLKMAGKDIDLYAIFKKDITTKLNYFDGSKRTTKILNKRLYNNETSYTTTLERPNVLTKLIFNGWSETNSSSGNIAVYEGNEVTLKGGEEYYGIFINYINIYYNYYNGNSYTTDSDYRVVHINADGMEQGEKLVEPKVMNPQGWTGRGWSKSPDYNGKIELIKMPLEDTTYYYSWEKNVDLSFNNNGANESAPIKQTKTAYKRYDGQNKEAEFNIPKTALSKNIEKDGTARYFDQRGWTTDVEGKQTIYGCDGNGIYKTVDTTTLYSQWYQILVGDYINYEPDNKNKAASQRTKYAKEKLTQEITGSLKNTKDIEYQDIKWKVFRIYPDGSMDITGDANNNTNLGLNLVQGYHNGVNIMHDMCRELYSRGDIKARNIIIDDVESWYSPTGMNKKFAVPTSGGNKYGYVWEINVDLWGLEEPNLIRYEKEILANGLDRNDESGGMIGGYDKNYRIIKVVDTAYEMYLWDENINPKARKVLKEEIGYRFATRTNRTSNESNTYYGFMMNDGYEIKDDKMTNYRQVFQDEGTYLSIKPLVKIGKNGKYEASTTADIDTGTPHTILQYETTRHTVNYDYERNGGIKSGKTSETLISGSEIDLNIKVKPKNKNDIFMGWNRNPDANYGEKNIHIYDKDVTLYAIFRKTAVGCYADLEDKNGNKVPDGIIDGIIYADLAIGGSGEGLLESNTSYTIPKKDLNYKEYEVETKLTTLKDKFDNELRPVIKASGIGDDRFYVMAIDDIREPGDENAEYLKGEHYFYFNGETIKSDDVGTSKKFGEGRKNTEIWINIWEQEKYGKKTYMQNGRMDIWGMRDVRKKVADGWFLPSFDEFSAFGSLTYNPKYTNDYNRYEFINQGGYWTSSQKIRVKNGEPSNYFIHTTGLNGFGDGDYSSYIAHENNVRLSCTF